MHAFILFIKRGLCISAISPKVLYSGLLFPRKSELVERENVLVNSTERISGMIEDFFSKGNLMFKENVIYILDTVSKNIKRGQNMDKSLEAISKIMQLPEVDNALMRLKKLKTILPKDPTLLGVVNLHVKFVDQMVQAQADLKNISKATREKGLVELDEAIKFFYSHLWGFYDVQMVRN